MSQEAKIMLHLQQENEWKDGKQVPPDKDDDVIEKVINFWPKSRKYCAYRHLWLAKITQW